MKDLLEIYRMSSYKTHGAVVHGREKPEGAFLRGVGVFGRCGLRGREREITNASVGDGRGLQVTGRYAKRSRMPVVHKDDVGGVFRPG